MASTKDRGYDEAHKRERRKWEPVVAQGGVECHEPVCLEPSRLIEPGAPWDLGHTPDRTAWTGPTHPRCNRSEGSKRRWTYPTSDIITREW